MAHWVELLEVAGSAMKTWIVELAGGVKEGFMNFMYTDPAATDKKVSEFAIWSFFMIGFSAAGGIGYLLLDWVRNKRGRKA